MDDKFGYDLIKINSLNKRKHSALNNLYTTIKHVIRVNGMIFFLSANC